MRRALRRRTKLTRRATGRPTTTLSRRLRWNPGPARSRADGCGASQGGRDDARQRPERSTHSSAHRVLSGINTESGHSLADREVWRARRSAAQRLPRSAGDVARGQEPRAPHRMTASATPTPSVAICYAQYAPRFCTTAGRVCSSSLRSQLRLQPVTYM
jgi:hypothetical protein